MREKLQTADMHLHFEKNKNKKPVNRSFWKELGEVFFFLHMETTLGVEIPTGSAFGSDMHVIF